VDRVSSPGTTQRSPETGLPNRRPVRLADGEQCERRSWDAIVVGTGMGGSTIGYALARAGWNVLFLEKGRCHLGDPQAISGDFVESFFLSRGEAPREIHREIMARAGRWSEPINDLSGPSRSSYIPFLGSGSGGSSALYGMALERFPQQSFAHWPFAAADINPHYRAAESLYGVTAHQPLHAGNQRLFDYLSAEGLHPYRLPMACSYDRGNDRCQGFIDQTGTKNDAARTCLLPALTKHGASLLEQCSVEQIHSERSRATGLSCSWQGKRLTLRAKTIVLAAGALATPTLLLKSSSAFWPHGLANGSDQVGRNLMRHLIDLYLVPVKNVDLSGGNIKQIAFNDWYELDGNTYGTVQSFGALPPVHQIVAELGYDLERSRWSALAPPFRLIAPLLRSVLRRKLAKCLTLASILEDSPCRDNTVRPGADGRIDISYRLQPNDKQRLERFRGMMKRLLDPLGASVIKQAERNERLAHACGTCRMGTDPATSVVDALCRAHECDGLHVVDASVFPTSGGTNPALTIAANALRVADHLIDQRSSGKSHELSESDMQQPAGA
jgi:choline dehydrogenase-like flavoprotein